MKRIIIALMVLSVLLCMAVPALAAVEEAPLEFIDRQKDVVFWVSWDVAQPQIQFLAPNGAVYDPMVQSDTTSTMLGEGRMYYVVKQAPAGQWHIRYDKGENTLLEVSVHDYAAPLHIEQFQISQPNGDRMEVKFLVGGDADTVYQYRISVVTDHTGMEKELQSGTSQVGRDMSQQVYLDGLSTYDAYMLKLYVWYDQDGADIFDFVYSQPFAYTNSQADAQASDFDLTVMPETGVLYLTVPKLSWNVDSVLVAVFENGEAEPVMYDRYAPDDMQDLQLAFDPAATEVAVEVSLEIDGVNAAPVRKTFDPRAMGISLPDGEAFNTLVIPMTYTGMSQQLTLVEINGYQKELVLNGDGSMNITLGDDWNDLKILYLDAQGITWMLQRKIFVDRIAPVLDMSQNYDGMTVETSTVTIAGSVVDYASVTINGQAVEVDKNGLFSLQIQLTNGANTVEVVAADQLGNESRYTAVVYHGVTQEEWNENEQQKAAPGGLLEKLVGPGSYWALVLTIVVCLMIIGYALIFWRKEAK